MNEFNLINIFYIIFNILKKFLLIYKNINIKFFFIYKSLKNLDHIGTN